MIICYVKTDEICYALKYDCYNGVKKNVYLVKLNTDRNKIIDEYSVTGEIINLSFGDVCRLYQGGDKVYLSINNADVRQFNLPNSNQLQQNRPFEFHALFVNNDFINAETESDCVSVIDSDRFYAHQDKAHETGNEESTNVESEYSSDSTDISSSTETEDEADVTESSIAVTTDSKEHNNNSNSKTSGVIIGIILLLLIITAAAVFVYFKFLKDKIWAILPRKQEYPAVGRIDKIDNSQKKIRIKNESTLVANVALKYPVDRILTNQDLADEKDEFGKRLSQIESIKFRYKINHRDYIFVECFKSGVNITNVLWNYSVFLLAFSQDYELIVGILEKKDCIVIKKIRDYACSSNVSASDLLILLSNHSNYQYCQFNSIFRQMIELLKETTSLLYNDSGANSSVINKLYVYAEKLGLEKIEAVCKEAKVIDINQKIKVIISFLIELYMAKPQNANFRANAWNNLEMRICELMDQLSELIPLPVTQATQQVNQATVSQPIVSETVDDITSAINQLNSTHLVCSNSSTVPQRTCKDAVQTPAPYHKEEDFMELYRNTEAFLSSKQEVQYFSPSNDSTVFNSGSYTLEVASYNWAADFIAIGNKLFLNPNKYKKAYLDESQRKDLRLDLIFNISGFNGRGNFSSIEPAIVELNSLKVVSTGKLRF